MHIMNTRHTIRSPLRQLNSNNITSPLNANLLQSASMDDLVVHNQLVTTIVDHQCPHASPPISKSTLNLAVQSTLVDNWQTLLDITTLSHADNAAIISHVQDAILLVDWAEHALNND